MTGWFVRLFPRPSRDRFATLLIDALRQAGATDEYRYEPEENRIITSREGKDSGAINLGNLYATYCETRRRDRKKYLGSLVRGLLARHRALPDDFDSAMPDLRPKLLNRAAFEMMRLDREPAQSEQPDHLVWLPVGEHLLVVPAYDWPELVQSIGRTELERWGVSLYEAVEVANDNLQETMVGYAKLGEGFYAFVSGDTYDATRILLVDRIAQLEVVGEHVAIVPNRDSLFITGSEDPVGLTIMAGMAEKALEGTYVLSSSPLVLRDGEWVDWTVPRDHELFPKFHAMQMKRLWADYADQKKTLDAVHEKRGIDVFVASFSPVQRKDGSGLTSYSVWAQGVDTLLPVTEKVFFMAPGHDGHVAMSDWDRVQEVVGHLMEPTDYYPPRFRVRSFPDQTALEAIGKGEL